jgi:hypothetical protein
MDENAARREGAREKSGRFGAQDHSDPELTLGAVKPRRADPFPVTITTKMTRRRPGLLGLGLPVREKVEFPAVIGQMPAEWAEYDDERGGRIVLGQVYTPVVRDGVPIKADDPALADALSSIVTDFRTDASDPAVAKAELGRHIEREHFEVVLLDDELWARAPLAKWMSKPVGPRPYSVW